MNFPSDKITPDNRKKSELMKLAENLSNGKYTEESQQRKRILQMIADELKESSESPP